MATVYAIASAKGGVGKTTTTATVATLLAESGADVVAIDADIGMANLADALGVVPGETTIHDVLAGDAEPEAAVHEGSSGLRVLPGRVDLDAYAAADPSGLREVVAAFANADYVLLDCGAGLSHDSTLPLGLADETLLVSTLERNALGDTEKTRQLVERLGGSVAGAAITRVGDGDSGGAGLVEEVLHADVLGRIPEDPAVSRASATGGTVVSMEPNAPASRAYRDLTRALTGATIEDPELLDMGDESEDADEQSAEPTGETGPTDEDDAKDEPFGGELDDEGDGDTGPVDDDDGDTEPDDDDDGDTGPDDEGDQTDVSSESGDADEQSAEPAGENPLPEHIPDAEGGAVDSTPDRDSTDDGIDGENEGDVDEELAESIPFRDDDAETIETGHSRSDAEDGTSGDGNDEDEDGKPRDGEDGGKGGFFSRLLGR